MNINKIPVQGFLLEGVKERKVEGIPLVYANTPSRNTNYFSPESLKYGVEYFKKLILLDPTYRYVLAKHAEDVSEEWIGLLAASIDEIWYDEQEECIKANITLLPTIWGHFIGWLLDNDYVIGVSVRGTGEPIEDIIEWNGKPLKVTKRENFKLEGFDFVIYPAFITTHATSEHIKEQYNHQSGVLLDDDLLLSLVQEKGEDYDRVCEQYIKDVKDNLSIDEKKILESIKFRRTDMGGNENIIKEKLRLEVDNLNLQKDVLEKAIAELENDKEAMTQVISQLEQQKQEVESQIKEAEEKLKNKLKTLEELGVLSEQINKKKEEIAQLEEQIKEKTEELQRIQDSIKIAEQKKDVLTVRIAGKVFDENNPPKIRVVPVSEKISNSEWSDVPKNKLRKLVFLTGDKKLASKVFGLIGDFSDWTDLKYPVYQPLKSEEDDYDIDLVLNRNGLATAVAFLFGRAGMALSKEEKTQLIKFLVDKYKQLEKEGIAQVPPTLAKAAKNAKILEKLEGSDDILTGIIEHAILTGMIEIENEDGLEDDIIRISEKAGKLALANAIVDILSDEVKEQTGVENIPVKKEDVIMYLIKTAQGTPTELADEYDLAGVDDFKSNFVQRMIDAEDVSDVVAMIKKAIDTFISNLVENPEDLQKLYEPVFNTLLAVIDELQGTKASQQPPAGQGQGQGQGEGQGQGQGQGEGKQQRTRKEGEEVKEQTDTGNIDSGEQDEPSDENIDEPSSQENEDPEGNNTKEDEPDFQDNDTEEDASAEGSTPENNENNNLDENNDNNLDKNNEEDIMLIQDLKELLESNFEGVKIESEEDIKTVIAKLITDYADVHTQYNKLQFERIKEQKISELLELGIDKDTLEEELEGIEDVEELETICDKLKNMLTKVKEQTQRSRLLPDLDIQGKGVSVINKTEEPAKDTFGNLLENI